MSYLDIRNKYRTAVIQYANKATQGAPVSEHVIDLMISVMMTRDAYLQGGHFVQAICDNDLFQAINRADTEALAHLKLFVQIYHYCYIEQLDYAH